MQEFRKQALANFPLKLIETAGDKALETWQQLKSAGQGSPVILGVDDDGGSFRNLLEPFGPPWPNMPPLRSVEAILTAAAGIKFPEDLVKSNQAEAAASLDRLKAMLAANPNMPLPTITEKKDGETKTLSREESLAAMLREAGEPPLGDWPEITEGSTGPSIISDSQTGKPYPKVYIGVAPTDDWTTIPAYLRWGGWNSCPAPEYHVAALRHWRDRYGAELVGMSFDTIDLRVTTRPKTREEALALAHDYHAYCPDIIGQGVGTYRALAAAQMATDWWFFWWD